MEKLRPPEGWAYHEVVGRARDTMVWGWRVHVAEKQTDCGQKALS